jgi:hypothetical protein
MQTCVAPQRNCAELSTRRAINLREASSVCLITKCITAVHGICCDVDGQKHYETFKSDAAFLKSCAQSALKTKAGKMDVLSVPIILQCDDTKGGSLKKYNPLYTWLMVLAPLPLRQLNAPYNMHMLCTSKTAHALEMAEGIVGSVTAKLENGIITHNAETGRETLVIGSVLCVLGDNPMLSTLCSHSGMNSNCACRCCDVHLPKEVFNMTPRNFDQFLAV